MDNPYRAPTTHSPSSNVPPSTRGIKSIFEVALRLVILAFCSVQFLLLTYMIVRNPDAVRYGISTGMFAAVSLALSLVFSFALLLAGVLLLFSRRTALWGFIAYIPYQLYGLARSEDATGKVLAMISLLLIGACVFYCLRLKRIGALK